MINDQRRFPAQSFSFNPNEKMTTSYKESEREGRDSDLPSINRVSSNGFLLWSLWIWTHTSEHNIGKHYVEDSQIRKMDGLYQP